MKRDKAIKLLGQIIIDLEELESINFLPHQIEKLKKLEKELKEPGAGTQVHGGGTGTD